MSLVSPDTNLAPRVVPKVFADVPSAQEIAAAQSGRTGLLVGLVLAIGLLVATAGGAALFWTQAQASTAELTEMKVQAEKTVAAHNDQVRVLNEKIAAATAAQQKAEAEKADILGTFEYLYKTSAEVEKLKADIADGLAKHNGKAAKLAAKPAYTQPSSWPLNKAKAEAALEAEVKALREIKEAVDAYQPPGGAGGVF